ncbi:hypothetical protein ACFL1H_03205 [Nanoarchaeota archaeon]
MVYGSFAGNSFLQMLTEWGFIDIILPFIFIFTVVYAIAHKVNLLGEEKKFHVMIALFVALASIAPHLMGIEPNPVTIMYSAIPYVSIWLIGIVMLLLFLGVFGKGLDISKNEIGGWVVIAGVLVVGYIFLQAAEVIQGLPAIPFLRDPAIQAVVVIVLVFGIIISYIVGPDKDKEKTDYIGKVKELLD